MVNRNKNFDYLLEQEQVKYDKVLELISRFVIDFNQEELIAAVDELVEELTKGEE